MYFGSAGSRGTEQQLIYELVANVLDCYLATHVTFVRVTLDGATISVVDNGAGLPFDEPGNLDNTSLATQIFTQFHWTRSQNNHAPHVHMNCLGVGLAPVSAASSQLTVRSWRSGQLWEQHFSRGFLLDPQPRLSSGDK